MTSVRAPPRLFEILENSKGRLGPPLCHGPHWLVNGVNFGRVSQSSEPHPNIAMRTNVGPPYFRFTFVSEMASGIAPRHSEIGFNRRLENFGSPSLGSIANAGIRVLNRKE